MSEVKGAHAARLPHLNLRPFLIAALGMVCGASVYACIVFGEGGYAGIFVFALFLLFMLPPFSVRRACVVLGVFALFALLAAGGVHLAARSFSSGEAGEYAVTGTVESAAGYGGYQRATLCSLTFDGARTAGKMEVTLPGEEARAGDVISFSASVEKNALPSDGDVYALSDFAADIRYAAAPSGYRRTGKSANIFLCASGALYGALYSNMERDAASFCYALLTGNMKGMDSGLAEETRTGGIAHVFAVSGLHIGMLCTAVTLLLRRWCGRWAVLPAVALGGAYCAMCAFTASSVRALLMCAFAGGMRLSGKKYDALSSLSLAAAVTLLIAPAQYFSLGFRLSYGAVAGMCLFSAPLARGLARLRLPGQAAATLVSGVSSQLFTFPLMVSAFGYFSVWGTLLNLFVIPALPALFLPLVACAFLSLVFPFAAPVLLALPEGLSSAALWLFSAADLTFVAAGFSLGAGVGVWLALNLPLCARVRLRAGVRAVCCIVLALLFALCVWTENGTFGGCRIDVSGSERGTCALIRHGETRVLLLDGDISLSSCEDLLRRTCAGELDAVCVLCTDEVRALNTAAFLPARCVYAASPVDTGLGETDVLFAESFSVGGLSFRYESADRLVLVAEGCAVEFCFSSAGALGADFFVGGGGGRLKYFLKDGIIKETA